MVYHNTLPARTIPISLDVKICIEPPKPIDKIHNPKNRGDSEPNYWSPWRQFEFAGHDEETPSISKKGNYGVPDSEEADSVRIRVDVEDDMEDEEEEEDEGEEGYG